MTAATRANRLKKLLAVQEQLKALHETRHAGHLAEAQAAAEEALQIARRFDADDSLSALFPDLYNRRIANALERERTSRAEAAAELQKIATATARVNLVERDYRTARLQMERAAGDRDRLELVTARLGKPAASLSGDSDERS